MGSSSNLEIERKFLVDKTKWSVETHTDPIHPSHLKITQGYLCCDPDKTVRVRAVQSTYPGGYKQGGFLTIKGRNVGITRPEYEYKIPVREAHELLALCPTPHIVKRRWHQIVYSPNRSRLEWEIDIFEDQLEGLVVAEVELERADQEVFLPDFILREVTEDHRYSNASFSKALAEGLPLPPFS